MNRWTIAASALILTIYSCSVQTKIKPDLVEQAMENGRLANEGFGSTVGMYSC